LNTFHQLGYGLIGYLLPIGGDDLEVRHSRDRSALNCGETTPISFHKQQKLSLSSSSSYGLQMGSMDVQILQIIFILVLIFLIKLNS
jgi:hypothetical protein